MPKIDALTLEEIKHCFGSQIKIIEKCIWQVGLVSQGKATEKDCIDNLNQLIYEIKGFKDKFAYVLEHMELNNDKK